MASSWNAGNWSQSIGDITSVLYVTGDRRIGFISPSPGGCAFSYAEPLLVPGVWYTVTLVRSMEDVEIHVAGSLGYGATDHAYASLHQAGTSNDISNCTFAAPEFLGDQDLAGAPPSNLPPAHAPDTCATICPRARVQMACCR